MHFPYGVFLVDIFQLTSCPCILPRAALHLRVNVGGGDASKRDTTLEFLAKIARGRIDKLTLNPACVLHGARSTSEGREMIALACWCSTQRSSIRPTPQVHVKLASGATGISLRKGRNHEKKPESSSSAGVMFQSATIANGCFNGRATSAICRILTTLSPETPMLLVKYATKRMRDVLRSWISMAAQSCSCPTVGRSSSHKDAPATGQMERCV